MRLRLGAVRPEWLSFAPGDIAAALVEDAYDAVVVSDLAGSIIFWNKAADLLYGRGGGLARGADLRQLVPEVVRPQVDGILAAVAEGQVVPPFKRSHTYNSGVHAIADVAASPVRDASGVVVGASFFVRYDVEGMEPGGELATAAAEALHAGQLSARQAFLQSEARYRAIVDNADQGIGLVDSSGDWVFVNGRMAEFLGATEGELVGRSAQALLGERSRHGTGGSMRTSRRYEVFYSHPSGSTLCGLITVTPVEDDETGPGTALVMVSDISDLKRVQEEREQVSVVDPVTDLANATLFYDRVERAVRLAPEGASAAVLVADIDRFRDVNDAFGRDVADDLLREVGARIASVSPRDATVARVVDDQFAVFIEEPGELVDLVALAERIHEAVTAPAFVEAVELVPSVSIGIAFAFAGGTSAPERTNAVATSQLTDDVLRRAHSAMRLARENGPGRTSVDQDKPLDTVALRLAMVGELHRAIRDDQLDVVYQPAVDLESGRPTSVEALVRWNHPERGVLEPAEFIPVAEDSGLVADLGRWVLDRACRAAVDWHAAGLVLPVAVNVSRRQLAEDRVVADVREVLDRTGIDPALVVLEVTESVLVDDPDALVERLRLLRGLGCRIAIDDFGTGYSSLAQLGRLPLDVLKIDRMFVHDVAVNEQAVALVRSVVDVARAFGLDVVAEGVETEEQRQALLVLGCPMAQGLYWTEPMPRDETHTWLTSGAGATS